MKYETFLGLPTGEVARLVRADGEKTCVFPINGTRRWFMLEHAAGIKSDFENAYLDIAGRNHIGLYQLLFEYGIDTLLTPIFGPDLLERGSEYMALAAEGLERLIRHPDFLAFYETHQVRVRFYGDYRSFFTGTPYAYLSNGFDEITHQTLHHTQHRLFFGVCAHDAVKSTAELAVQYYRQHGVVPDKQTIIEMYYGENLPPVGLFIGFGKLTVFDMPLLATGNEDLYFTISPSPYLTQTQLRAILYDHLYARREPETDYAELTAEDWQLMREFYRTNADHTLGVGKFQEHGGYWYPLSQVALPGNFTD